VWFDRDELRGGDAWDSKIKRQIHDCALFVAVISAHTNARAEGYFRLEWKLATRRLLAIADDAAFLVPVVVDDTREAHARVPEEFTSVQWTRLSGGEALPKFAQRVHHLLGADGASDFPAADVKVAARVRAEDGRKHKLLPGWLVGGTLIALVVVLGGAFFWYYQYASGLPVSSPATPAAVASPTDRSIAVLPFADMSPGKDQEYMSDGISEEVLNLLAQVPDLKVIARTSSFAFKGKNIEVAEIAERLNVSHVLEGSVRTSGDKLRITAQLIRAADSSHVWSEKYDRSLEDIFAVQDEIANAIVQALQIRLMGGALNRLEGGTKNLDAYKLYLRAQNALLKNTRESLDDSATYTERAVAIDPNYGRAWASLARVYSLKADSGHLPPKDGYERARQLAQHALQVSSELADAHSRLGYIHNVYDWDWAAAEAELDRALEIDTVNQSAIRHAAMLATTLGRWEVAERKYLEARKRDPLDPYAVWNLGHMYYLAGRFEESEATFREVMAMQPDFAWTRPYLAKSLIALGKPHEALVLLNDETNELSRHLYLPIVLKAVGRQAQVAAALATQEKLLRDVGAYFIAQNYAYLGDVDRSFGWLDRAYRQKDPALIEIFGEPLFKNMAHDSRFKDFLRKMNLPKV
jgi:TolB-like protein/Tfp pilus assembly protein PilF